MKISKMMKVPTHNVNDWINGSLCYDPYQDFNKIAKSKKKKKLKKSGDLRMPDTLMLVSSIETKDIDLYLYYDDPDRYFNDVFYFVNVLKDVIRDEYCRDNYVTFILPENGKKYKMSLIHFIYNMILWMPFFAFNLPIVENNIFMKRDFTNKTYSDYLNKEIIEPYKNRVTHNMMSKILSKMYDLLIRLCDMYSVDLGISFSLYDMISKWENQELYDISHRKIPKKMQMAEMEKYLSDQTSRFREITENEINSDDDSLAVMLRSGQINIKQLREFVVSIGTKPDINGDTYPYKPGVGYNLLDKGIRDEVALYVNSAGGRKTSVLALNINKGGYILRTACKVTSDITLNPDPRYDCGSQNYLEYDIRNKDDLESFRGRWYLDESGKEPILRQLIDKDYDMIGKRLKFRSPITCACKNGICKTCYGHLYNQNYGLSVGIISSLHLFEKNYQIVMSAKHLLSTNTKMITFNEEFYKFFYVENGYQIRLRDDIDNIDNYSLRINVNFINKIKDVDNLERNEYVSEFTIRDKETGDDYDIVDENKSDIFFSNSLFSIIKKYRKNEKYDDDGWMDIPFKKLNSENDIFFVRLVNNEINSCLNRMKSLIEKGGEIFDGTYSEFTRELNTLFRNGSIVCESIHVETIIKNLIRDKYNKIKLPDWSKENPEYIITSIHNAIFWSESITNSLSFEKLKNQLKDPLTYRKNATSYYDIFFVLDY